MNTSIISLVAEAHVSDLHRVAAERRRFAGVGESNGAGPASGPVIVLRLAHADDRDAVRDLAALDDARVPEGELLLALIDGEPVAALSLHDGRVVANPFVHTEAALALLRMRADHVSGRPARRRWPVSLRPRLA